MFLGRKIFLVFSIFISVAAAAQVSTWVPAKDSMPVVEGQAWPQELAGTYSRLPLSAKQKVTEAVWDLSENSAGLILRFNTNSPNIKVRYTVSGGREFRHMPATGVSGLDLYGKDRDGKWLWFPGRYQFADTITYTFSSLLSNDDTTGRLYQYQLYLPLYNTIKSLQVEYPSKNKLSPAGVRLEKPIVVYGTSIAQGGCASRPGLAWTSILERSMDRPLINLGFSGNGTLDSSVIDLLTEIDARVYILDCLPNLIDRETFPDDVLEQKIRHSVTALRAKRPNVPIVLSEHSAGSASSERHLKEDNAYEHANNVLRKTFREMQAGGIKNIYLLTNTEIGFTSTATVDGEHPTDAGMEKNAQAYERILRKVLNEPAGTSITTIPVSQSRDAFYFFPTRHQEVLKLNRHRKPETVFIGNSIVHMWGGEPSSSIVNGKTSWDELFGPMNSVNMGYGWDRVENVIWRIHHDELDGFEAKRIIVMIGTNNIGLNSDGDIIAGLEAIYSAIRVKQATAKLYLIGILPRVQQESRVATLNKKISALAKRYNASYADPGRVLLDDKGKTNELLFGDGLHPNEEGYRKLMQELRKILK